jgi:hypothetical protein
VSGFIRYTNVARIPKMAARFLLLSLIAGAAFAEIAPTPGSYELDKLFAKADAVCVGRVEHPVEIVSGTEGLVKEVLRTVGLVARRCYKGYVSASDTIEYTTHVPGIHVTDIDLPAGGEALVFLKETQPHRFTLAFPFWGRLEDASLGTLAPGPGSGMEQLQLDIAATTAGVLDRRTLDGNFRVLHGFPALSGETLTLLRSYSQSADTGVALGAFAALVKAGNPRDLLALCEYVKAAGEAVASTEGYYSFVSIGQIRRPEARTALECLARTPERGLSFEAMRGLRAIGSAESVPELMRHLDDSNSDMQYLAVITLQEIIRRTDEVGPSMPMFERDSSKFIQSWKRWWNDTGHRRYPGARRYY